MHDTASCSRQLGAVNQNATDSFLHSFYYECSNKVLRPCEKQLHREILYNIIK